MTDTPASPGSALDRWRQQRKAIAERIAEPIDIRIPGYDDPELWVRCRRLEPDELDGIAFDSSAVVANSDALIAACQGIYEGHPSVGRLEAERFDLLAKKLGEVPETHREAVRAVFVDDYALVDAGRQLADHIGVIDAKVEAEHQGE